MRVEFDKQKLLEFIKKGAVEKFIESIKKEIVENLNLNDSDIEIECNDNSNLTINIDAEKLTDNIGREAIEEIIKDYLMTK